MKGNKLIDIIDTTGEPNILSHLSSAKMKEPVIELNGWVTIKTLAAQKGCTDKYIHKLIKLQKMPVREYPELNGLRLVPGDFFKPKP